MYGSMVNRRGIPNGKDEKIEIRFELIYVTATILKKEAIEKYA